MCKYVPSLDRYNVCHDVCVCIEDQSNGDRHDVCTSYGTCSYMHMYLCAVKGGSTEKPVTWELHMHAENTVTFTQCVHVHKSVRVMFTYSAVRNKRPNSLQTCGTKLSGHSIKNTEKFSKVMPDGKE